MTRCEYIYDFERESADWSPEKVAHYTADPEQVRKHALLKGARCTETHEPVEPDSCSRSDCTIPLEDFNAPSVHCFTVGEKSYIMSAGVTLWHCWREDCGGSWLQR